MPLSFSAGTSLSGRASSNPGDDRARPQRRAARATGKLGASSASAVPTLQRTVTGDQDPKVREAAAFALGEITQRKTTNSPSRTVAGTLIAALADREPLVRRSALFALGSMGETSGARRDIEKLLDDKSADVRQNAAWALGRMGSGAIAPLHRTLRDSDPLVKRDAAGALATIAQSDSTGVRSALSDLATLVDHPAP